MDAERPIIVDRSGRHLIWDGSSQRWVDAQQSEQDRERYNGMPESMSGEDPSRDTEYGDNPKQDFGVFSSLPDHTFEEVPTDNYDRSGDHDFNRAEQCENCGQELDSDGDCNNCGMSQYDPGGRLFKGPRTDLFPSHGPFSERVPKMNYNNQGDNGTYGSWHLAEFDFSAPMAPPGAAPAGDFDFSAPARPGDGGPDDKAETHRFVIDRTGNVVIEPATFEHADIVRKHGLDETGRGSIYRNGTADVHRSWVPINAPELERTLGQHMGQQSIPLNYYPGQQEGMTEGNLAHGYPIKPTQGYIWKQEQGIPPDELAKTVPLVFAAEHSTPEDYPAYQNAKGFLTATGGATSHAVVEGRQRGMGGAVGIGPDYNKVVHGAPVSIREDGTVEFHPADPDSIVSQYFQRTPEDWQQALEKRRQKLHDYYMRTPEWQRPNRGGSVTDKSNDELAIEAMTFGQRVAANLDECPECGDVMVDRNGEKVCANCGHVQKIIQMEAGAKRAFDWNPIDQVDNIGGKGLEFAQEHPWETAGLLGAGALAVGTGGLAVPLEAGIAGGVAGEGGALAAGEGGALAAGELGAGAAAEGGAATGEQGAAGIGRQLMGDSWGQAPGRTKGLMNAARNVGSKGLSGVKGLGKGMLINQGINSLLGAGGGGAAGQQGAQQDYEGVISKYGDPRFDMWQFASSEDDPDSLQIGGHSDDGEGSTDPQTLDSQQETGDADDILKMLADDGSANKAPYSDDQKAALDHFNKKLPVIVEFAIDDSKDGKTHPEIEELHHMLEAAFPGYSGGDEDDAHKHEHQEEAHKADRDFPKAAAAHADDCSCGFCKATKGKGDDDDDEDDAEVKESKTAGGHPGGCDCGFCKNMRKNQGVDEKDFSDSDVEDDEKTAKTAWSVMDVSDAEMEAIFSGSPSIEFPDERTAAGMFPGMRTDTSPRFQAPEQPGEAGMYAQPGAGSPQMTEQAAGAQCANCGTQTMGKFCHECGTPTQSGHLQHPQASVRESTPPVAPTRVIPGPDSAVDKGQPINSVDGAPLAEGQTYMMKSKQYSIADEVTINKLKPNPVSPTHVEVTIKHQMPNGEHFDFPNEITVEDITNDGLSFEPIGQATPQQVQEAERGAGQDSTPDANEVTDLSGSTTDIPGVASSFEGEGDYIDGLSEPSAAEPVDGLVYTNPDGQPVGYEQYAASLRQSAPAHLAWLWDNVEKEVGISDRQREFARITAGKDFTHMEQREFINEPGEARNKDKLDLEGTHYLEHDAADDDELWFY